MCIGNLFKTPKAPDLPNIAPNEPPPIAPPLEEVKSDLPATPTPGPADATKTKTKVVAKKTNKKAKAKGTTQLSTKNAAGTGTAGPGTMQGINTGANKKY